MKKLIVSLLLTSVLATGVCVSAGCNSSSSASNDSNPPIDRSVTDSVATSEGFYSYAAASVGSIISSNVAVSEQTISVVTPTSTLSAVALRNQVLSDKKQWTSDPTEEQLATINGYMSLVENLLGEGKAQSVLSESDREGYEVKEVVSFSDLDGNALSYTMYYNRTLISVETEEDDRGEHDEKDEHKHNSQQARPLNSESGETGETTETQPEEEQSAETQPESPSEVPTVDEDSTETQPETPSEVPSVPEKPQEIETEYSIDGVMIVGEEEYALEGRYETETSREGEESETFFKVTLSEDSYIVMKQEIEEDEQSFVYATYAEGRLTESVKFSYETERNETQLKMTVTKDGAKSELKFKDETERNGERKITVKANLEGQQINFTILVTCDEDGNEVYRYAFGEKIKDMFKPNMDNIFGNGNHGNGNQNGNPQPERPQAPEEPQTPVEAETPVAPEESKGASQTEGESQPAESVETPETAGGTTISE